VPYTGTLCYIHLIYPLPGRQKAVRKQSENSTVGDLDVTHEEIKRLFFRFCRIVVFFFISFNAHNFNRTNRLVQIIMYDMDSPRSSGQLSPSRDGGIRKRMRKGTHSCFECRFCILAHYVFIDFYSIPVGDLMT
jgi:hypothetical protein